MSSSLDLYYPPQCQICQFYTYNPHLRCTLHSLGLESDNCLDFRAITPPEEVFPIAQLPEPEEQWQPEGAAYYNGELILQPRQRTLTETIQAVDGSMTQFKYSGVITLFDQRSPCLQTGKF